jgi:hypothetical protein
MTNSLLMFTLLFATVTFPALAQSTICWEITTPAQGVVPEALILLNKCEGKTWIMTRVYLVDKQGKRTGGWVFRWSPILHQEDETILTLPKPN